MSDEGVLGGLECRASHNATAILHLLQAAPLWIKLFQPGRVDLCTCWLCDNAVAVWQVLVRASRPAKFAFLAVGKRDAVPPLERRDKLFRQQVWASCANALLPN